MQEEIEIKDKLDKSSPNYLEEALSAELEQRLAEVGQMIALSLDSLRAHPFKRPLGWEVGGFLACAYEGLDKAIDICNSISDKSEYINKKTKRSKQNGNNN